MKILIALIIHPVLHGSPCPGCSCPVNSFSQLSLEFCFSSWTLTFGGMASSSSHSFAVFFPFLEKIFFFSKECCKFGMFLELKPDILFQKFVSAWVLIFPWSSGCYLFKHVLWGLSGEGVFILRSYELCKGQLYSTNCVYSSHLRTNMSTHVFLVCSEFYNLYCNNPN